MAPQHVTGLAKFFPTEAWAIAVPVTFITAVAGSMITRWVTQDPESRNINIDTLDSKHGAAFREQVRGFFRTRLNGDWSTRAIFNNKVDNM